MIFQLKSYISFFFKSIRLHGIHSPFVYELNNKCFENKEQFPEYQVLKNYRNELLNNHNTIEISDFGAGSRVFKSNERRISRIAKHAGITTHRQRLLLRLINYLKPTSILELGTSLGLGTAALALGNNEALVTSVEGCKNTLKVANSLLEKYNINNVRLQNDLFDNFLRKNRLL